MNLKDKKVLYFNAWKLWGSELQVNTLIEEMAELIQASMKARRNNVVFNHMMFEELADVEIMVEQMKVILTQLPTTSNTDKNLYDIVKHYKNQKLNRLSEIVYQNGGVEVSKKTG